MKALSRHNPPGKREPGQPHHLLLYLVSMLVCTVAGATQQLTIGAHVAPDEQHHIKLLVALQELFEAECRMWVSLLPPPPSLSTPTEDDTLPDIMLTSLGQARIIERNADYQWLGLVGPSRQLVLVHSSASGVRGFGDLRGRVVSLPPRTDPLHHLAARAIRRAGIEPGKHVAVHEAGSHYNALSAAIAGATTAAMIERRVWQQYRPFGWSFMSAVEIPEAIPAYAVLVHRRLGWQQIEQLRTVLLACVDSAPAGFCTNADGLGAIRRVEQSDLDDIDAAMMAAEERWRGVGRLSNSLWPEHR